MRYLGDVKVSAHFITGETEVAQELIHEKIQNGQSALRSLTKLDPDRSLNEIWKRFVKDPDTTWLGPFAAGYCVHSRFVDQSAMQETFVKDGKWIKYLAERSEVYSRYLSSEE